MTPATLFVLLFVLHDSHGNFVQRRIINFTTQAACEQIGNALKDSITWKCEAGPPPKCEPPSVS
jgi:hypothetical protein